MTFLSQLRDVPARLRKESRQVPTDDIDESEVEVDSTAHAAAGATAVAVAMRRAVGQMGPVRTASTLLRLNQVDGFDCQGCAWPDPAPGHRHTAEFCENGAKAVAEEATRQLLDREFFATHSVEDLAGRTEFWLGKQGRITEPMVLRPGATHYEPISWDDAFTTIAGHLNRLDHPDQATFYTSGKTSNEAAFAYQLFVRSFGTNNLPDCSNMCHESSGSALVETIGIGKGSVSLEDIHQAKLILVVGQNPGTNHPRMLSALEEAKSRGAKIISVNPLQEAGLVRFKNPQHAKGLTVGTALSDLHLPIRLNGDLAFFQAVGSLLIEWDALDHDFLEQYATGFEEYAAHVKDLDWAKVEASTGLTRDQVTEAARMIADSPATITCWAMGITQHHNAVGTIKEIVNVALLQGNIGKPGAGVCPVRGHSNVQGDRTMGIWERVPDHFLDAIRDEFGFEPPREHGLDTVGSIQALRDGKVRVFFGDGRQLRRCRARHRGHRGGHAQRGPHRARVDQAQPLARRARRRGADPAGPRPQREGPHRRQGPAGHRRGLDVGGARLARAARPAVGAPEVRGRHHLLAGPGHPR